MAERFEVFWDWSEGGNVAHIAERGVQPEEVEQVLVRGLEDRRPNRGEAEWIVQDFTDHGTFLAVPFDMEWVEELGCWLVTPRSAYEPQPPGQEHGHG